MPAETRATPTTASATDARDFLVVWQNPETRELLHVGTLSVTGAMSEERWFRFTYTDRARAQGNFTPFAAFPDLDDEYASQQLSPFFQNRVMSPRRSGLAHYLSALGLSGAEYDPVELLARAGGDRATDTIQIVPAPVRVGDRQVLRFLVSGVRHVDPTGERTARLRPGQHLAIRPEPQNEYDARALLLDVVSDEPVGYVPSYLLDYVHRCLNGGQDLDVIVERVNLPPAPWHLRVLVRLEAHTR